MFGRCIIARRRVLAQADHVFRRVWDHDSASYFFANVVTGETSWYKLRLYLSSQPPVLSKRETAGVTLTEGGEATEKSGGSPRLNPKTKRLK